MRNIIKKIMAACLAVVGTGSLIGGLSACSAKSTAAEKPANVEITKSAAPTDGSLPTAHTGAENLAYIAGVLANQNSFHLYTYTKTQASIATQITKTVKDYKDGVMVATDITYSSVVKSGTQACVVFGDDGAAEVYMRYSAEPSSSTTHLTAKWDTDAPIYFTESGYLYKYGLLPTELTNYIINENTILSDKTSAVTVNSDGTYTQSFVLDTTLSTYYYQYGMKTRGGLSGYPSFKTISLSVTFDSQWRVLSHTIHEVSEVNKGINVTSTSDITTTYSYDAADFDEEHFAYYTNYFAGFIGSSDLENGGEEEDKALDVTGALSGGFSKVLGEGQQFGITLNVGKKTYMGYVFLRLDLTDPLSSLYVKLSLGKTLAKQTVYVEYSGGEAKVYCGDTSLYLSVDEFKPIIDEFVSWVDELNDTINTIKDKANAAGESVIDADSASNETVGEAAGDVGADAEEESGEESDLLSTLLSKFTLEEHSSSATLTLAEDDLLGTGVGVNLKVIFGVNGSSVSFRGATISNISIGGTKLDLSVALNATTAAEISREDIEDAEDITDYASSIYSLVSSKLIKVDFTLDGSADDVKIKALKNLQAYISAYIDVKGVVAGADFDISYIYGGKTINVKCSAYYDYLASSDKYGDLIVTIKEVNGVEVGFSLYCGISELADSIGNLIKLSSVQAGVFTTSDSSTTQIADIINGVLNIDFSSIVTDLYAKEMQLVAGVDIDVLLQTIGVDCGVKFGSTLIKYSAEENTLSASLPALGLALSVSGVSNDDYILQTPDTTGMFDLAQLLQFADRVCTEVNVSQLASLADKALAEVKEIINTSSVAVTLPEGQTYLTLGGITVGLDGKIEVVCNGTTSVTGDLVAYLTDDKTIGTKVKFVYENVGETEPLLKLALGDINSESQDLDGIEIYQEDLDKVSAGASKLKTNLASIVKFEKDTTSSSNAQLVSTLLAFITDSKILGALDNLTFANDENLLSIIYNSVYTADLEVSTDGDLGVSIAVQDEGKTVLKGSANLAPASGTLKDEVFGENCTFTKTSDTNGLIKTIYNYVFATLGSISLADALGDKYYCLDLDINGSGSAIPAMQDISVKAKLYFGKGWLGDKVKNDTMFGATFDIDANGTVVQLTAAMQDGVVYLSLDKVSNITLPGLKVYIERDNIYSLVEQIINALIDTNILSTARKFISGAPYTVTLKNQTSNSIADIIDKLLSFDFATAVKCSVDESGTKQVLVDVDNIAEQLGFKDAAKYTIGFIKAQVTKDGEIKGSCSVTGSGEEWLSLTAYASQDKPYSDIDKEEYISVDFLPTLLSDVLKFATDDDGNVYTMYTFAGTITASVIGIAVTIDISTLTVGLDDDNNIYFTLIGYLDSKVATNSTIGITYHDGYLTLGRDLSTSSSTSSPTYKICTLDYFVDHMFDSGDTSTLNWLLRVDSLTWWGAATGMNSSVKVSSGAEDTKDVYLYDTSSGDAEKVESLYSYINALKVIINDTALTEINDISSLEKQLGISNNYYGVDLNAKVLTGDVLTTLYAAITRDAEKGINGIKAYGAIQSYVTFSLDLSYQEGLTKDNYYKIGSDLASGVSAPSLYEKALGVAENNGVTIDFNYSDKSTSGIDKKFGCFNTSDSTYGFTEYRLSYNLTIVDVNGNKTTQEVRTGSTVYTYSDTYPVYTDSTKVYRLIYAYDSEGNNLCGESFVMTDNTTIYAIKRLALTITVYDEDGNVLSDTFNRFNGEVCDITVSKDNYVMLGLYYDSAFTSLASGNALSSEVNNLPLYAKFIEKTVTVNGVTYTFDKDNLAYSVTGTTDDVSTYYDAATTLYLESYINGYPVTSISANAFEKKSLKNVVVPATITYVGEKAFLDNYGIKTVVFLADTVTLDGSDKKVPFYGCSEASSGTTTSLSVYYNAIIDKTNTSWTYFRNSSNKKYYITQTYGAGTWSYISGLQVVNNSKNESVSAIVSDYICNFNKPVSVYDYTSLKSQIEADINKQTAPYGYIDSVVVSFATSKDTYGGTIITVTVEDATPKYLINCTAGENGNINYVADEQKEFDGNTYVSGNVTITANANSGYAVENFTVNDNAVDGNSTTFEISGTVTASATFVEKETTVNLKSAIAFTYNGVDYSEGTTENVTVVDAYPEAEGYVFLGWVINGEFANLTEEGATYTAIWGKSNVGTEFDVGVSTSGTTLKTPTGNGSTLDGNWYTGTDFATTISSVTDISDSVVLYTRNIFTLTVTFSSTGWNRSTLHVNSQAIDVSYKSTTTQYVTIYEGTVTFAYSNSILTVTSNNATTEIYATEINGIGSTTGNKRNMTVKISGTTLSSGSSTSLTASNNDITVALSY